MKLLFLVSCALAAKESPLIVYDPKYQPALPSISQDIKLDKDFMFGYVSSAFQVEGAVAEDGKSQSIWDKFASKPSNVNNQDPKVSVDEYHLFNETVQLLKLAGATTYRMSISWTRIVPEGFAGTAINKKGVEHYNQFFNLLIDNGITPFVTLYHYDLPQVLHDKYNGFLHTEKFTNDFLYFAEAAFSSFKQIKYWITFNEPITFCTLGYAVGAHAPGKCFNQATCLFRCAHTSLVAHAYAVDLYRRKFGGGKISIANNGEWSEPMTDSPEDVAAAQKKLDLYYGYFMEPLFTGAYPKSVLSSFSMLMPKFSEQESKLVKGSIDFVALNHFTSTYTAAKSTVVNSPEANGGIPLVSFKAYFHDIKGNQIGKGAESPWLFSVPWGFQKMLEYIHNTYNAPEIYITANGYSVIGEQNKALDGMSKDLDRINYYNDYLQAMSKAQQNGVKVKAFMASTLMDNFEWARGYDERFGSVYVDRSTQQRYLKDSAYFLRKFFTQTIQTRK